MKWFERALSLLPVLGLVYPQAAPFIPILITGISEAQEIHGADKPADKKAHVLNLVALGANAATATKKVVVDSAEAVAIAQSVFAAIDFVHALAQAPPTPTP